MKPERTCVACDRPLRGRTDKRYCTAQCRSAAHNRNKQECSSEKLISQVNAILRKNRTILKNVSPEGKTTIQRQVLELIGFDFRYLTLLYRTQKGSIY